MNIWIVNHYAQHPARAGGTRHFALAKALVRRGHQVTIVASNVGYMTPTASKLSSGERTETIEGVVFRWVKTPTYKGNGIGRVVNMLWFAARVLSLGYRAKLKPDVVLASSPHPFAAFAAQRVTKHWDIPFVLEVRDIWPETLVELGRMPDRHPFIAAVRWLIERLYSQADHLVYLLPGAQGHFVERGGAAGAMTWIPNGVDTGSIPAPSQPASARVFRVMYAGAHGVPNGLATVLETAQIMEQSGIPVEFHLVGDGPEKGRLIAMAQEMGLRSVRFRDPVPKSRIYSVLAEADAFLMLLRDSPVFRWGISPNKLFDYMACARPIIFGVNTPVNPVEMASAGVSVPPEDPRALAEAITRVSEMSRETREELGRRAHAYVLENHDLNRLAERLESVLETVVGIGARPAARRRSASVQVK